ncbi:MAG: DUF4105 domain-containing protein [Arenimonas sp.]|nr:DUF4105 domain-containing protein [Arenimonas sp.]
MPASRSAGRGLLLVLLLLVSGFAGAAPRIGVITMEPGEAFWERFGHDAILVVDPVTGAGTSYNFGFFDMSEPGFVGNFIRGYMRYYLVALPVEEDLADYQAKGRGVSVQWLDLDANQARNLSEALAINARPENARYRYEYFADNCSTRVRDALDRALGGKLKQQLVGRSLGNTYRSESVRLAWPAKWMALGFHLGMSGYGDRPLTRWEEAFIPMRLRDSLREVRRADGRPLVSSEQALLPHRLSMPPEEMPRWRLPALLTGITLAVAITWLGRRRPRWLAALALPFWLVAALTGAFMIYLWCCTAHVAGHGNQNILLFSPLCLLLLPGGWRLARGRAPSKRFHLLIWAVAGSAAIAGFLKFLPFLPQENVEWVLMLLPIHLALAKALSPRA